MRKLPALVLVLALFALPALAAGHGEESVPESPETANLAITWITDWIESVTSWLGLGSDPKPDGDTSVQTEDDGSPDADTELGPYVIPSG